MLERQVAVDVDALGASLVRDNLALRRSGPIGSYGLISANRLSPRGEQNGIGRIESCESLYCVRRPSCRTGAEHGLGESFAPLPELDLPRLSRPSGWKAWAGAADQGGEG